MKAERWVLLGAFLILGALTLLFARSVQTGAHQHARFVNSLRLYREADAEVSASLLRSRYVQFNSYDALEAELADLRRYAQDLQVLPDSVPADAGLVEHTRKLKELAARKSQLVERYKSDNAVLRNSLNYFPGLCQEVAEQARAQGQNSLVKRLEGLSRDVLYFVSSPNPGLETRIQGNLDRLAAMKPDAPLAQAVAHARSIMTRFPEVDATVREVLELPTEQAGADLMAAYQRVYLRTATAANFYRLILFALAVTLLAYASFVMDRLRDTASALADANRTLEDKVAARTEQLRGSNALLEEANQRLHYQATHDNLTGLLNRGEIFRVMGEIRARAPEGMGVVMLDVDHFKKINDTYGHQAGDEALRCVSRCVRETVAQEGFVGRYGGEELVTVVPRSSGLAELSEKVRQSIEAAMVEDGGRRIPVTASLGFAVLENGADWTVDQLVGAADAALVRAKRNGRNRVQAAQPEDFQLLSPGVRTRPT